MPDKVFALLGSVSISHLRQQENFTIFAEKWTCVDQHAKRESLDGYGYLYLTRSTMLQWYYLW